MDSYFVFLIRYYQFDKEVVRELLGKKLTGRLRKDLDDVSEKTNIPLKSCRRQVGLMYITCSLKSCTVKYKQA